MSYIDLSVEGTSITKNPPTYVKEVTLIASDSTDHYEMNLVLFDETWVTVPSLLRLGLNQDRVTDIVLSMGWPFEGGHMKDLKGSLLTMKQNITPEGIEYTLRGRIGPLPNTQEGAFKSSYVGTRSEVATEIATNVYGISPDKQIIEATKGDKQSKKWSVGTMTPSKFLASLAAKATPAEKAIPPGMAEEQLLGLYAYFFHISRDKIFRFHSLAHGMAYGSGSLNPVKVTYP